jgi:VIT1/CCC1 family predicted Fe2+/Mn2+ transporter
MAKVAHVERHFTAGELVRDIVIGMSDGLTVPFALAAGLASGLSNNSTMDVSRVVVVAGMAEIAAGSIAMGLGGYLAARGDAEHYENELQREHREIREIPDEEAREVSEVFQSYGLTAEEAQPVVERLRQRPGPWVDFMMRFELGLERPEPTRARNSAVTIALSYIAGGVIPLSPYMIIHRAQTAFLWSVVVTLCALGCFGYVKGRFTGTRPGRSALQTIIIGGVAAAAAFALARAIS